VAATARGDADPKPVRLADVIAALPQAPATPIAVREAAAADADVGAANAWPSPAVHVQTNRLTAKLAAGLLLPLPIFGTLGAARHEAAARAAVVHGESAVAQRELRRRAVVAWIALARAGAELEARAVAAHQAADLERVAKGRLAAGAGGEVDVTTAAAARARADVAVSSARHAQAAAAAALAGVVGWDPMQPLRADGAWPGATAAPLEALRARLPRHPDHALATARVSAADATTARARKARYPGLGVEVQVSFDDPTTPGTDVLGGLLIDVPIFARTGDQIRAASARAAAERARLAAEDAQLGGELVAAYRRWQAASETVAALERDVLPAQERAAALATQAYREGARDLSTALQADRDLAGLRADLATARGELATAAIELQVAAGEEPGGSSAP